MALTSAYLVSTRNLGPFLEAIRSARAPERVTVRFIEDLGFKSTNDRLFIPLLKALRLVDENGAPTQRYFEFLDESRWKAVLAAGVQDAYEDLFRLNKRAYKLSRTDLIGKLKSLTEGKKSDTVLSNMAMTFSHLVKVADFDAISSAGREAVKSTTEPASGEQQPEQMRAATPPEGGTVQARPSTRLIESVVYRIEIVLPSARDKAVYDAIFRSVKEHLL